METTTEEQIKNAIKWIDELPNYKQAPMGKRSKLGNADNGYCCLGAGCVITGTEFISDRPANHEFQDKVGLIHLCGDFIKDNTYFGEYCLAFVNDNTDAGFKRISKLLKTHPDWIFKKEVAEGIRKHYSN